MTEKILNRSPLPEEVKNFREKMNIDTANKNGEAKLSDVDKAKGWKLAGEILTQEGEIMTTKPLQAEERTDTCSFIGAMMEVQEGGKITRLAWNDKNVYILKKDDYLMLYKENKYFNWVISGVDMDNDDWIVLT